MKGLRLWSSLGRMLKSENLGALDGLSPADRLIQSRPDEIRDVIAELARGRRSVEVMGLDGVLLSTAELRLFNGEMLSFALQTGTFPALKDGRISVNIVGVSNHGAVLFTTNAWRKGSSDELCAELPIEIIKVQSREYFRLTGLDGPAHRGKLKVPGLPLELPLHDISEQGLGLQMTSPAPFAVKTIAECRLHLDDETLTVPKLQIVYNGPVGFFHWRIGAKIEGMSDADCRILRRWISLVETNRRACSSEQQVDPVEN